MSTARCPLTRCKTLRMTKCTTMFTIIVADPKHRILATCMLCLTIYVPPVVFVLLTLSSFQSNGAAPHTTC